MTHWFVILALGLVAVIVLASLTLHNTEKLLCKPTTAPVPLSSAYAEPLKQVDGFPQFTSVFPSHWSGFPSEISESAKQVVLPGAFGTGTEPVYKWIEAWMLIDAGLTKAEAGPLPHLTNLDVNLVLAGVNAYKLKSRVEGMGIQVLKAVYEDGVVVISS